MELPKAGRTKLFYTSLKALEHITTPDEDAELVHSSGLDSADSEDEAEFIEGTDPSHDVVDDEEEEEDTSCSPEAPCALERGRGRSQPSTNRSCSSRSTGKHSRSETLPGDVARWRCETDPDNLPHPSPHFLPKRQPGLQPPLAQYVDIPSPSELFKKYFYQDTIKTLCANTNKYAARNIAAGKKLKWTEVTEAEMYQYIGMTVYMGVLKLPKIRDFWRTDSVFSVPYPAKVMSRDRFLSITWNIHLSDPAEDALNDSRKGTHDYDCLHRIRPLYESLCVACKAVYHPSKTSLWMSAW
ncbi:uncharacterized protein LOC124870586 [Girardinichthys multiradiatus]|uniref:uncharacterized protein LOC124870586 n=1 Tax=Girardinichthys multiradiatus TaxID=208333 RepID=UPI001FABA6E4|nr:uncharacterized protein LOC124870586 [Girardinichthys multiradiatus]